MGWFGYGIYDGDETQTLHYDFLKYIGIKEKDLIDNDDFNLGIRKTKLPDDIKKILSKEYKKILIKMPKIKFWDEDSAIEWQMLLALFLDADIKVPKIIRDNGITATEYLMGDHASDFNNPSLRRRTLKRFIKKAKERK